MAERMLAVIARVEKMHSWQPAVTATTEGRE
jgi:hypothetical protein